ncbi:MAG: MmgE/PrpD family protein [Burkholderiales bacterium]
MDASLQRIVDYGQALSYADLPASTIHECKRRLVDTLGCALGAFHDEPVVIARKMALRVSVQNGARIIGTAHRTLPELAAFANGVMGRYLDGNDTYPGGGGHPSDMVAAVMAVADAVRTDGKTLITALTFAYEVYHNFFQPTRMRDKGMDNVFYTAVGGAAGAAKILGLDRERMANAVSLAITPNISLEATRRGKLSMWKGAAAGNAARNGVFAALLAAEGMTGPEKPVEDERGLIGLVGKFDLAPFGGNGRPHRITHSSLKYFLSEYHSQSPITTALMLQPQVRVEDIAKITVYTQYFTWFEIGSEPEKWHPDTRETADHSLPWILAGVFIDGHFSDELFSEERLRDPRIHALTDKIVIKEEPEFTRVFPDVIHCRIEIETTSGERKVAAVEYPRGHFNNPMTDDEVNDKFRSVAQRFLPKTRTAEVLDRLWRLETAPNLDAVFDNLRIE